MPNQSQGTKKRKPLEERPLLGVYIHIPFCASKCSYCDFYSREGCENMMPDYHEALLAHIHESSESLQDYQVNSIYFGGGTPSYYGADRICDILDELKQNGNVRTESEITVECNPDSTSLNALKLLRQEGVNRISLGVQATDDNLLRLIGRRHTFRQAEKAIANARKAGFDNISVDLMYGLPSQTKSDWATSLAKIVALHPEHISCYGLKLEEGTPMYREYNGSPVLPDDDEQADMYCYACEMLSRYGYKQYEISNFCIPGYESKHNLKYWNLEDYMGFGPDAASCIRNLRYKYIRDLKKYITGVQKGSSLTDEYQEISPLERAVEYIMLAMRTSGGISEEVYKDRCKCSWEPIFKVLKAYEKRGWVVEENNSWHFTVQGYLISNTLIGLMIEAQSNGYNDNIPWMTKATGEEARHTLPKSEQEMFIEHYSTAEEHGTNAGEGKNK